MNIIFGLYIKELKGHQAENVNTISDNPRPTKAIKYEKITIHKENIADISWCQYGENTENKHHQKGTILKQKYTQRTIYGQPEYLTLDNKPYRKPSSYSDLLQLNMSTFSKRVLI